MPAGISKDAEVFNMKCDPKDLLLYAVTDRHWLNGRTLVDVVKESLDGGVTMIQLREKSCLLYTSRCV